MVKLFENLEEAKQILEERKPVSWKSIFVRGAMVIVKLEYGDEYRICPRKDDWVVEFSSDFLIRPINVGSYKNHSLAATRLIDYYNRKN